MVHKSEVVNTKKAENPFAQANYYSTQSFHLQELVPSHLSRILFDHVILEGRQSLAANSVWDSHTQKFTEIELNLDVYENVQNIVYISFHYFT